MALQDKVLNYLNRNKNRFNVAEQIKALPEYVQSTQFGKNVNKTLETPVKVSRPVANLINTTNRVVNPIVNKYGEGFAEASTYGVADVPFAKSKTLPQRLAYTVGFGAGMANPLNPINKFSIWNKVGQIGGTPTRAIASKIVPQTGRVGTFVGQKLLPAIGSEVAQTGAFGGVKRLAGQSFDWKTDLMTGVAFRGGLGKFEPDLVKLDKGAILENNEVKRVAVVLDKYLNGKETKISDAQFVDDMVTKYLKVPKTELRKWTLERKASELSTLFDKNQTYAYQDLPGLSRLVDEPRPPKVVPKVDDVLDTARKQIGRTQKNKPLRQTLDELYTDWVNRFHPIEKLEKGVNLKSTDSPTIAIKRLLGAGGKAELRYKKELQPIFDQVDDIPKEDIDVFLKARRDLELATRDIKGSDANQAKQVLDALSAKYDVRRLDKFASDLYAYQSKNLQELKDAGFLDEEAVKNISNLNQSYVPFNRIRDDIDNFLGLPTNKAQQATSPIKKIKGSERAIESPLESIVTNTFKTEAAVAKNRVARTIANLPNVNPELAEIIKPTKNASGHTISVWQDGKKTLFEVPEEIERAVKGLDEEQMGTLIEMLSLPSKILRQGATGRNVEFMIPNIIRDQFDAALNAPNGYIPFVDYFAGLSHVIKNKWGGGDELVEKWINSGGKIFFESMTGRKNVSVATKDVSPRLTRRILNWVGGGFDTLGELSETPTRVGIFRRSLNKTGDVLQAASDSREGTLDFARMGAKMKTANSLIPFLNVGVQGFDRMVRSAKNHPKRMTALLATYAGLPQLAVSLYNNTYHGEDYAQVPDFEKEGNFIIMTGANDSQGNPTYIKIPKGHIQQLAANPTDNFVTWLAGTNPQSFGQMSIAMLSGALPVVGDGKSIGQVLQRTMGDLTPQALKPSIQQVANFNFFKGDQIVPQYMTNKEPNEQVFKTTPAIYKKIGDITNTSPLRVKDFAETAFAGFATQPSNLIEVASGRGGVNKTPIARRFIGSYEGFDVDRPKSKEGEGFLSRVLKPTEEVSASEELPTNQNDLKVLYDDARRTISAYPENSAKIRTGLKTNQTLPEAQAELVEARRMIKLLEKEQPEIVLDIGIDTFKSGSGMSVEKRAEWVKQQLEKTSDDKKDELLNRLWDEKVITSGKDGVAQYLYDELGIDVWKGVKKSGGSGTGKAKKGTIHKDFRSLVSTSTVKPTAIKLTGLKSTNQQKAPNITSLKSELPEFRFK